MKKVLKPIYGETFGKKACKEISLKVEDHILLHESGETDHVLLHENGEHVLEVPECVFHQNV